MKEDIKDTEIRVIGEESTKRKISPWIWALLLLLVVAVLAVAFLLLRESNETIEDGVFEPTTTEPSQPHPLQPWMAQWDSVLRTGTVTKDTIVNDIPLRIFLPLNTTPRLEVGYGVIYKRQENILLFQAADIRADNRKIVGAFVLRGQPLSYGLSKRGYCAIIDGKVHIGVADNSPLFEEATEKGGYFFRQYPLVDNCQMVENELKTKSIRRGLCELEDRIVVVESLTDESLHDFSQALVDIGTTNAVYLVGSTAIGWACDLDGNGTKMGLWDERAYKNVNFIVWSKDTN